MQPRKAYTLMEVILVMTLIVIMAGIGYPSVSGMFSSYRLRAATDNVRSGWVKARAHAVEEGQRYRFAVVPGKGNFRIAPDRPEFWSGTLPELDRDNPPLILEDALPGDSLLSSGIVFTLNGNAPANDGAKSLPIGSVDPGQWVTTAYFEPDGTAQDDVDITFSCNDGGRPLILSLRALTGLASVKKAPVEGQR